MIRVPENLIQFVDFEDGEILVDNLPEELEKEFEDFKRQYKFSKLDRLTEY